jgi:hypothetical protein
MVEDKKPQFKPAQKKHQSGQTNSINENRLIPSEK